MTKKKAQPYHHGELRSAMIAATEAILREHGIEGFSLREAARRAGVSAGAPAHHFGDAKGLLTEVALLGYEDLGRRLAKADRQNTSAPPAKRMRKFAQTYVEFALDQPALFRLMFRKDLINRSDPRYKEASLQALGGFVQAALSVDGATTKTPSLAAERSASIIAAWSFAHGMAHLALEEKLGFALTAHKTDFSKRLLPAILNAQWPNPA